MAYNRNIPQPTDLISNSQPSILGNFQAIDSGVTQTGIGFSRNHVTITDGTNGGLHNRIDFYQNISTPSISGFVSSLYPLNVSSASELTYTNSGGTTQITSGSNAIWKGGTGNGLASTTLSTNGQLNLPNGFQLRWGQSSFSGSNNSKPVSFSPAFSNSCFVVNLNINATATNAIYILSVDGLSNSGFTAYRTRPTSGALNDNNFYWVAIGN